jgi:hypothetical protein
MFYIAGHKPTTSPTRNVTLTISITPSIEKWGLFSKLIVNTKSKKAKIEKPCYKTLQFSGKLHCHPQNQCSTKLIKGYLAP